MLQDYVVSCSSHRKSPCSLFYSSESSRRFEIQGRVDEGDESDLGCGCDKKGKDFVLLRIENDEHWREN